MLRTSAPLSILSVFLIITMTGCEKKTGEAVVLSKEHIDAALPRPETPNTAGATGTQPESAPTPDVEIREMADDEIAVEGYVMKPEVRGTSRDPRALKDEQWLVK